MTTDAGDATDADNEERVWLISWLSQRLGMDEQTIADSMHMSPEEMGMDSILMVFLGFEVARRYGVSVEDLWGWRRRPLEAIAGHLAQQRPGTGGLDG